MLRRNFSRIILTVLMASSLSLQAQNVDYNITGSGARAEGLGGAFIGVADDATAVLWNPGGLTQLEKMEASVVTRLKSQKSDATDVSASSSNFALNFASFAYPMKIGDNNVVFALAFQRQLDMNFSFEMTVLNNTYSYEVSGGVNTITPAAAIRLSPLLSAGLAANIWTGSYKVTSNFMGNLDASLSGFNLVFGGMADLSALPKPIPMKIGVSLKTPFSMKSDQGNDDMPLMLGIGASYQVGDNLVFAADFETRAYKSPISESDKGLNQVRIGGEYLVISRSNVIPIRAGFHTVPTVMADQDALGNSTSNQVSGTGFSIGTGYIASKFAIDIAYTFDGYEQKYGTESIKYSDGKLTVSLIYYLQ
jgi:hypothetical protein